MRTRLLSLIVLIVAAWLQVASAQDSARRPAGRIKSATGSATLVREGQTLPAAVGSPVFPADVLRTGADGALAVMLQDNSRLSIGPGSEIAMTQFDFSPAESRLGLVLRVTRGVLSFVSGRIAKLAPGSVKIETPTMVIGVRGTHALVKVDGP